MNVLAPLIRQQFFNNSGAFNAGGLVYTYFAGSSTPAVTYNSTGHINVNPVVLDSNGSADIWLVPNTGYKILVTDPAGNTLPGYPIDNIYNAQLLTLFGGTDTGTTNAYSLTFTANFSTLSNGIVIYFVAANTNTGPSTLTVNSLGTLPLINQSGTPLAAGQILSNQAVSVMYYNGSWLLVSSPLPIASGTVTVPLVGVGSANITLSYQILGQSVTLYMPYLALASSGTVFDIAQIPSNLQPVSYKVVPLAVMQNNSAYITNATALLGPTTTIALSVGTSLTGWSATGTKGIGYLSGSNQVGVTITYDLF